MTRPRGARAGAGVAVALLLAALGASPVLAAAPSPTSPSARNDLRLVPRLDLAPAGRTLTGEQVARLALAVEKVRGARARAGRSDVRVFLKGAYQWQVSVVARRREIALVIVDDGSRRVTEAWTGFQVAWTMARGYPGAFGRSVNALWVWLPLCVLFVAPFVDLRRPFRLVHLDLLVILSFSVSLAFFNHAAIHASVPLAYPPLLYLLGRLLHLGFRRGRGGTPPPPARAPRLLVGPVVLAVALVFLVGFRFGLNARDANVIDVGYSGVIGADRILHGAPLYGSFPRENDRGDTYGPAAYLAYVPSVLLLGWSGRWDDLPAAHLAAALFDLACIGGLFLLGRRARGPTLGLALAYAWAACPWTLFALNSDSNDSLVAAAEIAGLLVLRSPPARGALAVVAGLTKLAPLGLIPLLATADRRGVGSVALFALGATLAALALLAPILLGHGSLATAYERTLGFQNDRASPFSVWGLYPGLSGLQTAAKLAALALCLLVAWVPRGGRDLVTLAALAGACVIALQLTVTHWFYLYVPWFLPFVLLAVLGTTSDAPAEESGETGGLEHRLDRVGAPGT